MKNIKKFNNCGYKNQYNDTVEYEFCQLFFQLKVTDTRSTSEARRGGARCMNISIYLISSGSREKEREQCTV